MMSLFKKVMGIVATAALVVACVPRLAFASYLAAPADLDIEGYYSTNDATPTFTWDYSAGATWYEYRVDAGNWVALGNQDSYTLSFMADGWHTFFVRANDARGNVSSVSSFTFEIDTQGPTVSTVSPATATEDARVTFSVTSSAETGGASLSCTLYVDSVSVGNMTQSGSTFYYVHTFAWDGTYTVYARCQDGDGNVTSGTSRTVTVYDAHDDHDDTFVVPAVSPLSADEDESVTFTVTPYGDLDAERCDLYVSGAYVGHMYASDADTFSRAHTFSQSGSYPVYAYCEDEDGDWTRGTSRTVTVSDENDDRDEGPRVPAVSPSTAIEDEVVTITVEPDEDDHGSDVRFCDLYVNGSNVGDMDEIRGEFSLDHTFRNSGTYTVYASCTDEDGDTTRGTSRSIRVSEENDDSDDDVLTVPKISPSSAIEDEEVTFTLRPTGDHNITACWMYVEGSRVEEMDEMSTNVFTADHRFTQSGSYDVYARCEDSYGNTARGDVRSIDVEESDENGVDFNEGSLIKIACSASSTVSDPCRAVYYFGEDGKRHAFPNESTFYSWYRNFDDVVEITSRDMAAIRVGENVTYRPGSVLVKFSSSSKVYAIEAERTLRHYRSMELVEADYGSNPQSLIMTLPDSLYSSYDVGSIIDSRSDFDRTDAYYSVDSIEDIF